MMQGIFVVTGKNGERTDDPVRMYLREMAALLRLRRARPRRSAPEPVMKMLVAAGRSALPRRIEEPRGNFAKAPESRRQFRRRQETGFARNCVVADAVLIELVCPEIPV
jgi:hypothetical protein